MNEQSVQQRPQPPAQTWRQMCDEHVAMELAEARERIADLETFPELLHAALELLHEKEQNEWRLRDVIRRQNEAIRVLRAEVVTGCNPRRRAA